MIRGVMGVIHIVQEKYWYQGHHQQPGRVPSDKRVVCVLER